MQKVWNSSRAETEVEGYPYYCPSCDENTYAFETEDNKMSKVKFMIWDCAVSVTKYSFKEELE